MPLAVTARQDTMVETITPRGHHRGVTARQDTMALSHLPKAFRREASVHEAHVGANAGVVQLHSAAIMRAGDALLTPTDLQNPHLGPQWRSSRTHATPLCPPTLQQ